jgi:hypothetical protein
MKGKNQMFESKKQITKVEKPITPLMEWKKGELYSRQSVSDGKGGFDKTKVLITEWFAMDIWRMQEGWFWWTGTGTPEARRHTVLAPFGQEAEHPNEGAVECYSVPVHSVQLGAVAADFVIENAGASTGFQALLDVIKECGDELKQGLIPCVRHFETIDSDDGLIPAFEIVKWLKRPDRYGVRLLPVPV